MTDSSAEQRATHPSSPATGEPQRVPIYIFGGGVAGLSAAHELAKFESFDVHVFEKELICGGKAASNDGGLKFGAPTDHRYAGEHGFRLFPHFYRHVIQTMKEIPFVARTVETGRLARRGSGQELPRPEAGVRMANPDDTVWGNLIGSTEAAYARDGVVHKVQRPFPASGLDFLRTVREMLASDNIVNDTDLAVYSWMLLKYVTSCSERREEDYERMTWLEYLGVGKGLYSDAFENLIRSVPRVLSAMRPDICSARSVGNSTLQLLFDFRGDGGTHMESVLAGPTQETWLDPWVTYLRGRGVHFWRMCSVEELTFKQGKIVSARMKIDPSSPDTLKAREDWGAQEDGAFEVRPPQGLDAYFVAALPLEVMQRLLKKPASATESAQTGSGNALLHQEMIDFDYSLQQLQKIERGVAPMVGIQFFLTKDVPVCNGHVFYPDSPWALTSISQAQFWEKFLPGDLAAYLGVEGSGYDEYGTQLSPPPMIRGILSVIISDWNTETIARPEFMYPPPKGLRARDMSVAEIKREVWAQLKEALNVPGAPELLDDYDLWQSNCQPLNERKPQAYVTWLDQVLDHAATLDPNVMAGVNKPTDLPKVFHCAGNEPAPTFTPLFVHPKGSYELRPDAELRIPNLLLASDYVRTYTDLATMEGANEAAKRAVLAILRREVPVSDNYPQLFPLTEGRLFEAAQELDRLLYNNGGKQPHIMDTPHLFALLAGGFAENIFQTGLSILGIRRQAPPEMARTGAPRSMAHVELAAKALERAGGLAEALRGSFEALL